MINTSHKRTGRHGFTLVEMLLVLVILATLAAIVIPKLAGRSQQAKETKAIADIAALKTAINSYEVDTGSFPPSNSGFSALLEQPANVQGWQGPYLDNLPIDPWGQAYTYVYPGKLKPSGYDIICAGPDMRMGTDDDIDNSGRPKK